MCLMETHRFLNRSKVNTQLFWFHQGLYIGYDSISVLSQSVSLQQAYLLLELSSSSLLAGTSGNRRRPAATGPLVFSVVWLVYKCSFWHFSEIVLDPYNIIFALYQVLSMNIMILLTIYWLSW